jgi:hypothetical protein
MSTHLSKVTQQHSRRDDDEDDGSAKRTLSPEKERSREASIDIGRTVPHGDFVRSFVRSLEGHNRKKQF